MKNTPSFLLHATLPPAVQRASPCLTVHHQIPPTCPTKDQPTPRPRTDRPSQHRQQQRCRTGYASLALSTFTARLGHRDATSPQSQTARRLKTTFTNPPWSSLHDRWAPATLIIPPPPSCYGLRYSMRRQPSCWAPPVSHLPPSPPRDDEGGGGGEVFNAHPPPPQPIH